MGTVYRNLIIWTISRNIIVPSTKPFRLLCVGPHMKVAQLPEDEDGDWRRPQERRRTTYVTEGTDADVQSANIGIHSAWTKANDRVLWRRIIDNPLGARH